MRNNARSRAYLTIFLIFFLILSAKKTFADGFIIPVPKPGENIPPLTVKYHRVDVQIINQVAKTSIDQVFINNYHRDIEGIFVFPLPEKVAISEFSMYIGEKKIEGEILDSDKARRIYEDIVRRLKDPALLEYIGRNMFRARVYPIPAGGEKRIKITYSEILRSESDLVRYVYPLNTERFSLHPIKEVAISVKIESAIPLASIYSSSHKVSIRKEAEGEARISFEGKDIKPDKDFILYYGLSQQDVGISLLSSRGLKENYFMLLAAPRYLKRKERVLNKNLIFVLDSSGSMSGRKILQAKEAVRFIINHLDKRDRFSIIDFDDGVNTFSPEIIPATPENRYKALSFVDEIEDAGGTNINEALLRALRMVKPGERPNYILFLTDGRPTVGITGTAEILKNISQSNTQRSRIFVFGVGNDVNTELLDRISSDNRGPSVYVSEDENLELAVSNYYEKIASPLLSDLKVEIKGIEVMDVYPRTLPDLFRGSQLILVGKYKGEGPASVVLQGKVGKEERTFVLKDRKLGQDEANDFLPRLWATRRIGYLLQEIRLQGEKEELVDEVKRLGLKYGIVTPYTSFIVTEEESLTLEAAAPEAKAALTAREVTGAGAVKAARVSQKMKTLDQAIEVASVKIKYKKDKTFYLKDGYWVDSEYQEGASVEEVRFNSDEYFRLLAEHPGIAAYLSVDKKIILCYKGISYKIVE